MRTTVLSPQTTVTLCFQSPTRQWGQAHRRYYCGITPVDTRPAWLAWHSETRRALQTETSAPPSAMVKLLIGHVRRYTHLPSSLSDTRSPDGAAVYFFAVGFYPKDEQKRRRMTWWIWWNHITAGAMRRGSICGGLNKGLSEGQAGRQAGRQKVGAKTCVAPGAAVAVTCHHHPAG